MRPFTASEKPDPKPVLTIMSDDSVTVEPPEGARTAERTTNFKFTKVHAPTTSQVDFYDSVLKPVVDSAVNNGRHGLLFAYGESNA